MLLFSSKSIATLTLFLLAFTQAQELTPNAPQNDTAIDTSVNALGIQCDDILTRRSWPKSSDCAFAVQSMPQRVDLRHFTRQAASARDENLPQRFTVGRCRVTIDLKEGANEAEDRWFLLAAAADRVVYGCTNYVPSQEAMRSKGRVIVGSVDIRLEKMGATNGELEDGAVSTF